MTSFIKDIDGNISLQCKKNFFEILEAIKRTVHHFEKRGRGIKYAKVRGLRKLKLGEGVIEVEKIDLGIP